MNMDDFKAAFKIVLLIIVLFIGFALYGLYSVSKEEDKQGEEKVVCIKNGGEPIIYHNNYLDCNYTSKK